MILNNENDIERLISLMAKLPGLGPRSARRAVLHLIRKKSVLLKSTIGGLKKCINKCKTMFDLWERWI